MFSSSTGVDSSYENVLLQSDGDLRFDDGFAHSDFDKNSGDILD